MLMPELLPEECDCQDAELDILTGVETCYVCGSRRWLSGEELREREEAEARLHAEYDQMQAEEFERQQHELEMAAIENGERPDIHELPF